MVTVSVCIGNTNDSDEPIAERDHQGGVNDVSTVPEATATALKMNYV